MRQMNEIRRALISLCSDMTLLTESVLDYQIAVACALSDLNYLLIEEDWHKRYPKLDCWHFEWRKKDRCK